MKKFVSIIAAASLLAVSGAALAADNNPEVYVNGAKIFFDDQKAVIVDERTLVPARGVFEAMGATVEWDGEKQQVQVKSADDNTWVRMIIDDTDMKIYDMSSLFSTLLSGQDFHAPETVIELDVAPQILNDRTMIPLRAVSEAFGSDVKWDEESYSVNITTADAPTAESFEGKPAYSLTASADTVNEGETVDVYLNLANIPEGSFVSGITATIQYDKSSFEFVSSTLTNGDNDIPASVSADNAEFDENELKLVYITIDSEAAAKADGKVMKVTFKSLNGEEGKFIISNGYQTRLGYNTTFLADYTEEDKSSVNFEGNDLFIDTTPLVINAAE